MKCTLMFAPILCMDLLKQFLNSIWLVPALLTLSDRSCCLHELTDIDALSIALALLGLALTFALHLLEVRICLDSIK